MAMLCSSSKSVAILALAWFAILPAESRMVSTKTFKFEDSPVALHELAVLADCTEPVDPMEIAPRFSAPKFGVLVDNVPTMLAFVLFVTLGAVTMFMDSFEFTDEREGCKAHGRPPRSEQLSWATLALLVLLVAGTWQATSPGGSAKTTTSCQPSPLDGLAKLNVFDGLALGELDHFSYPNDTAHAGDSIVLIVVLLVCGVLALIPMYADAEEIASEEAEIPVSQCNSSTSGSFQCLLVLMCLLPVATLAALPSVDSITLSTWQSASLQALGGAASEKIVIIVYFIVFVVISLLAVRDDFLTFAAEEDACAQRESISKKEGKQVSWSHTLMQQWRLMSCVVMLLAMCGAAVSELWQNAR